jgi:hypothetical protein
MEIKRNGGNNLGRAGGLINFIILFFFFFFFFFVGAVTKFSGKKYFKKN